MRLWHHGRVACPVKACLLYEPNDFASEWEKHRLEVNRVRCCKRVADWATNVTDEDTTIDECLIPRRNQIVVRNHRTRR